MSLEQALAENTATMKTLITVLQSAAHVTTAPAPTKPQKAAAAPTAPLAQAASPASPASPALDAAGNPIGTQYFDVPAHNTVFAVKPGDMKPEVAGSMPIADSQYVTKKAEYSGKIKAAGTPSSEPAAAAPVAQATTAAPAPSAQAQPDTASAAEPAFTDVVAKVKELHGLKGNEGVMAVLTKYGVGSVPQLQGKASNAELISATNLLIDQAKMGL